MSGPYYVYQHTFENGMIYVGKGKGPRAYVFKSSRNRFWRAVQAKYGDPVVTFAIKDCDEELAFLGEQELVHVLRMRGTRLINLTEGGEGTSGYRYTEEQLADVRARRAEYMRRPEVRQKYAESTRKYMIRPETKAHMAVKLQERMQDPGYRAYLSTKAKERSRTPENLQRRAEQMRAMHEDPALKAKMRGALERYWATDEARAAQSERRKEYMQRPEVRERYSQMRRAWLATGNRTSTKHDAVSLVHISGRVLTGTRQEILARVPELTASALSALIHGRRASAKNWTLHDKQTP